jgi:S-adenosylmethionine decarboxylase
VLTRGIHYLCELSGCWPELLASRVFVAECLLNAAQVSKATVIGSFFHEFSPQGVTGFVCLAESHLSIHTWPEKRYAAIDIYTCGQHTSPELAIGYLKQQFGAETAISQRIHRGVEVRDAVYGSVTELKRAAV